MYRYIHISVMGCRQSTTRVLQADIDMLKDKCEIIANDLIMMKQTLELVRRHISIDNYNAVLTSSHEVIKNTTSMENADIIV